MKQLLIIMIIITIRIIMITTAITIIRRIDVRPIITVVRSIKYTTFPTTHSLL